MLRQLEASRDEFSRAMDDDFNTPAALTAYIKIVGMAEEQAKKPSGGAATAILSTMRELGSILGVLETEAAPQERFMELVKLVLELRSELRAKREYALADRIRERMMKMGLLVEDTAEETRWIG